MARWGGCTKGLVRAFSKGAASIAMEVVGPGGSVAMLEPHSRQYWERPELLDWPDLPADEAAQLAQEFCIPSSDVLWAVMWYYSLGTLDPGDYDLHFVYTVTHSMPDGADWDGDGKPDKSTPENFHLEADVTIQQN
ncbi:MAG: hypothetical protein U9R25_12270 [Chloroflexota bacterium]|nr:hypothetical protein [Chloroflexota bacterium]